MSLSSQRDNLCINVYTDIRILDFVKQGMQIEI